MLVRVLIGGMCFALSSASLAAPLQRVEVEDGDLESQIQALDVPSNEIPPMASREKLYSVQKRMTPLQRTHELSIGGARNFTPENYLNSWTVSGEYRFHLSERWSIGTSASAVFNSLSGNARRLIQEEGVYPDTVFSRYLFDVTAGFNIFYGKLRLSMERVLYFDLYGAAGPGLVDTNRGMEFAGVLDLGLSLWFGEIFTLRFGVKDYIHPENRFTGKVLTQDFLAHLNLGVLIGGR